MTKMTFLTLNEQKRERRKRRFKLLALSLGAAGVLAALFMARLLASVPKCPGHCQKQQQLFQ